MKNSGRYLLRAEIFLLQNNSSLTELKLKRAWSMADQAAGGRETVGRGVGAGDGMGDGAGVGTAAVTQPRNRSARSARVRCAAPSILEGGHDLGTLNLPGYATDAQKDTPASKTWPARTSRFR